MLIKLNLNKQRQAIQSSYTAPPRRRDATIMDGRRRMTPKWNIGDKFVFFSFFFWERKKINEQNNDNKLMINYILVRVLWNLFTYNNASEPKQIK